MKKLFFILLFILGFTTWIWGSICLVMVQGDLPFEKAEYLEDGIMTVFFDAGHIVFNDGRANEKAFPANKESFADIAMKAGANYVIAVNLGQVNEAGEFLAEISLYRIDGEIVISLEDLDLIEEDNFKEFWYNLGLKIGKNALDRLHYNIIEDKNI